ncbi:S-methyl-5-thioribose-1-phosphate isomerase [Ferroacidibacillus organovorans]|nr:S-methyl-5-thioribose-1-phosphate isomerase [Ferroacidibacillus organovorans]
MRRDFSVHDVRPVELREEDVRLIDQRMLPEELVYVDARDAQETAEAIRAMVVRGAPAIAMAGAFGFYLEASRHFSETPARLEEVLMDAQALLLASRPTAVNLSGALSRMMDTFRTLALREVSVDAIVRGLREEALAIQAEDEVSCRQIGEHLLTLYEEGMGVLTHCNTGGLATSRYGTALAGFYLAKERGMALRVYADETRPYLQGSRLTAWELLQAGVDVTVICDNMAATVMAQGLVRAVVVGADRIAANGDTANKIGTMGLAVLARHFGIPFYVAAPTSTIDPVTATGSGIPIETRPEDELTVIRGARIAPVGVAAYNPAFDVTPNELITAIITETGIYRGPYAFLRL